MRSGGSGMLASWLATLRGWLASGLSSLRLSEPHVLAEQLRLIYGGMTMSVLPMFPAVIAIVYVLDVTGNDWRLYAWAAAALLSNGFSLLNARYRLKRGYAAADAPRLARQLIVSLAVGGTVWGALIWTALGRSNEVGNILILCVVAGIVAGGLSLSSPVLPAFLAFAWPAIGMAAVGFIVQPGDAYNAFIVITIGYGFALTGQAKVSSLMATNMIELKFQNTDLLASSEVARQQSEFQRGQADLARQDAEQANHAKTQFLAAASHDLRQPIHAQGLFLDVLHRMPMPPEQARLVGQVIAAREATAEMLNTLLDFSRVDAGVVQPAVQKFRMQTLLNKLEREFAPQADAQQLAYRSRECDFVIESDPALVALIARNLVANAIRYTHSGGVLVTCRQRGDHAELLVHDTGIGIAPEHHAHVFREFHQLGNPERDRRKGLGLGLAIAQKLADTLGEQLSLRSRVGRGSVFGLTLRLAAASGQGAFSERSGAFMLPAAPAFSNSAVPPLEQGASPSPTAKPQGTRVLLVEDEEAIRSGMTALLQSWGYACEAVESIAEAQAAATRFEPHIIVSDFRLRAGETGIAAVQAVRYALNKATPAVLITGDTAPERLREAAGSGLPLLHKPVEPEALRQRLRQLLDAA